jgi:hypothetical protein
MTQSCHYTYYIYLPKITPALADKRIASMREAFPEADGPVRRLRTRLRSAATSTATVANC